MGKKKAPTQPTTKSDTGGLFGSAQTGSFGSTFNPTSFQSQFVNNAENAMINAQNAYNNREIAQEAVDDMNRQYQTDFQNQLLAPALSKGWLRGSTAQDVATVANQDYQNRRYQLVNDELSRNQQALANNLANYLDIYNVMTGVTGLSNSANKNASDFLLSANSNNNNSLIGSLIGAAGNLGSAYLKTKGKS